MFIFDLNTEECVPRLLDLLFHAQVVLAMLFFISFFLPEPILISPLCCMKMVSQVKLPWIMGGSHECK